VASLVDAVGEARLHFVDLRSRKGVLRTDIARLPRAEKHAGRTHGRRSVENSGCRSPGHRHRQRLAPWSRRRARRGRHTARRLPKVRRRGSGFARRGRSSRKRSCVGRSRHPLPRSRWGCSPNHRVRRLSPLQLGPLRRRERERRRCPGDHRLRVPAGGVRSRGFVAEDLVTGGADSPESARAGPRDRASSTHGDQATPTLSVTRLEATRVRTRKRRSPRDLNR